MGADGKKAFLHTFIDASAGTVLPIIEVERFVNIESGILKVLTHELFLVFK